MQPTSSHHRDAPAGVPAVSVLGGRGRDEVCPAWRSADAAAASGAEMEAVGASVLRPGGPVRVYIAGPYTKGDVAVNVRNAIVAGQAVLEAGHVPFIPHLNHFWHLLLPQEYAVWIRLDLEWLYQCEALIRLPGDSAGADAEYVEACRVGIPVFRSVEAFLSAKWCEERFE